MIDADVGKKFVWSMLRDVDKDKIVDALKEAFAKNGYSDQGKIGKFIPARSATSRRTARSPSSTTKAARTRPSPCKGSGSATINGVDFMKGVWSIWFGSIDQKSLGDQLISAI